LCCRNWEREIQNDIIVTWIAVIELPTWYDVDDQAALTRLLEETAMPRPNAELLPYAAPHTTRDLDLAAE
jgi:hypothetical protein